MSNFIELCLARRELFENVFVAHFEMVSSAVHTNDDTINTQEIVQQDVETRWHDTLEMRIRIGNE